MAKQSTPRVSKRTQPPRAVKNRKLEVVEHAPAKKPRANTGAEITKTPIRKPPLARKRGDEIRTLKDAAKFARPPTDYTDWAPHDKMIYYPPDPPCPSHPRTQPTPKERTPVTETATTKAPTPATQKMAARPAAANDTEVERPKRTPPKDNVYSDTDDDRYSDAGDETKTDTDAEMGPEISEADMGKTIRRMVGGVGMRRRRGARK